ncbi:hypothetical protein BKA56DRAFT_686257 [Ilyonectria sp. MPI-CAGE-AT-0026]|nr:hypothetical protein BKA56DRAFT_686257 [Ilyonectria sp. MPI-CAGE-AT-0026]
MRELTNWNDCIKKVTMPAGGIQTSASSTGTDETEVPVTKDFTTIETTAASETEAAGPSSTSAESSGAYPFSFMATGEDGSIEPSTILVEPFVPGAHSAANDRDRALTIAVGLPFISLVRERLHSHVSQTSSYIAPFGIESQTQKRWAREVVFALSVLCMWVAVPVEYELPEHTRAFPPVPSTVNLHSDIPPPPSPSCPLILPP